MIDNMWVQNQKWIAEKKYGKKLVDEMNSDKYSEIGSDEKSYMTDESGKKYPLEFTDKGDLHSDDFQTTEPYKRDSAIGQVMRRTHSPIPGSAHVDTARSLHRPITRRDLQSVLNALDNAQYNIKQLMQAVEP